MEVLKPVSYLDPKGDKSMTRKATGGISTYAPVWQVTRIGLCIGYLDHPFEKEDPWAFTARIFLVVKWGLAIEIAGEEFSYTRETRRVWAADHEDRPAKAAGEACHRPLQP
jgi:hypothetical protein